MKILVTGAAGFIGFHTSKALLARGDEIIGLDNFNNYYDPTMKEARAEILEAESGFTLVRGDFTDRETVVQAMQGCDRVCHLGAMAGVRYSLDHPEEYINNNYVGTFNIIDEVVKQEVGGLVYASSSSVFGGNESFPSNEEDRTDDQIAVYGMTKKCTELMAHTYHQLHGVHTTGLRFFTAYGPWGRPDMALFIFTKKILAGETISVFGEGKMKRDFTFIDDIVSGIIASIDKNYPDEVFNLGRGQQEELMEFIEIIEQTLGKEAEKEFLPMQKGDVTQSFADISKAREMLGYDPQTTIREGVPKFVEWYKNYFNA